MIQKLKSLLDDMREKKKYVQMYWYSLKYFVHSTHSIYKLFYKIIKVYGTKEMASKCTYHNLIYGPRPIETNRKILNALLEVVDIQLCLIYSMWKFSLNIKMHDQLSTLLSRSVDFLVNITVYEKSWSEYTRNGLPIKYEWILKNCQCNKVREGSYSCKKMYPIGTELVEFPFSTIC